MEGKICLVTGATSGIGRETALSLAGVGATLVLGVRDVEKGQRVAEEISRSTGNRQIEVIEVDLANLASVRRFVGAFKQRYTSLHVLVNNAGLYTNRRTQTPDGFETTMAVNHLGPFLLTNLLVDMLIRSAPARIVTVSSEAQRAGRIHFDDLQLEKDFSGFKAYTQSKLANILFTRQLSRKLEGTGVTANSVHPGAVRTNFARGGGAMRVMMWLMWPLLKSPTAGARGPIMLSSSPDVEGVTGRYFVGGKPAPSSPQSNDDAACARLWELSSRLVGLNS